MRSASLFVAALLLACSSEPVSPPSPTAAFLAPLEGQWVGVLTETGALQHEVIREMPMRLTIGPERSTVEYPTLRCSGVLEPPPEGIDPPTEVVARLMLVIDPPGLSPCMPGLVKLTRHDDALKYVFLGDTLRRVRATLIRQP
ncbi:MAG: hypothetical protein ACQGVC_14070 [Myxococcota bacterium]